ncbi:hypothetical protein [Leptolyngbya sp. 7M]|uniref:hypothetical protein n=1 Tax=Leptolyngbya sp. 7M TaxID=2812896 RepID=UPI001B8CBCDA|nr:hypothetical protein [Leptolyngbya sp. 7M]QYO64422.1 hypothetical protein JVX88_32855 [Leptolyngbya sp. 7M]
MKVDLIVHNIGQLVTCTSGNRPKRGPEMNGVSIIENAAVAIKGGVFTEVGRSGEILGNNTPMALAAAEAVLLKLREGGEDLQQSLAEKVNQFATHLNQHFERVGAPIRIDHFTSYFYVSYPAELPYAQILFYLLREKGVHIWDHRPCFFTLSHTDADIEFIIRVFKDSVAELQVIGFLPSTTPVNPVTNGHSKSNQNSPPQPGARLGKDPEGNPAWFIPDPDRSGKYLQVGGVL